MTRTNFARFVGPVGDGKIVIPFHACVFFNGRLKTYRTEVIGEDRIGPMPWRGIFDIGKCRWEKRGRGGGEITHISWRLYIH